MKWFLMSLAAGAALACSSFGDEVLFKNGDRLTGKIKNVADGKLIMTTAVAGDVTINMALVKTFKTDAPVEMHLVDGSVIKQPVSPSPEEGKIATAGGAGVAAQAVAVANVKTINPPPVKWTGSILANATFTRGNTNTDQASVAIDAVRRAAKDRISLAAGYMYGRENNADTGKRVTTTDNWFVFGKYDYFLTKKAYIYAGERVEQDHIAGLHLRSTASVGYGYQWLEGPRANFSTEAGIAWIYEDYRTGGNEDHFALRLAYHYDRKLSKTVGIFNNMEWLPSVEDISDMNLNADIGIRADLIGRLFSEFKIEWKYDATPAPDAMKNDFRYIAGLGWRF